jgi:death-on-curing family protein
MPVIYPEGGMPGMLLKQMREVMPGEIDTFKVQLIPLRAAPTAKIGSPEDIVRLVREMEDYDRESAKIIHLDTKNQVMGVETISIGSLSASIVHPRETVTGAILNKSANVIFVHNHPSGICEPSQEDINISVKLKEAFELVGIVLLDSIIVGKGCHYSLREVGFITGKSYPATSGMVREPKASQETKGKVDFITAMTDYITAPDLERRKRAAEKIQVSKYFKPWFDEFFYEHDRESAKRKLMKFFAANEQGLGVVNHSYYGVLTEYLNAISKPVAELTVRENTNNTEAFRNREFRKSFEKMWDSKDVNNIEAFLNRLTVDTSRYSHVNPLPDSLVIGAAIPGDGFLFAYHVTDDPGGVMRKLKSNITLCQLNPAGDLGCGLYVSGVPEYWRVRSTGKWEFAKNLTRAQRQSLVNVILSDPNYKKGGGYLADFEVDYLTRDLKQFVETGDVNLLAGTGSQPYNVHITKEIARKAGVPEPKEPGFIKIKLQGKFINAAGLYSNQEVVNRAKAWAVINRPKLLEWNKRVSTQNVVNAWLCSMGYCGAFTKSGMSTNPEMVIWGRKAIVDAKVEEEGQKYMTIAEAKKPPLKERGMIVHRHAASEFRVGERVNKDGNELTAEYIIILHDDVIEKLGGEKGVRDRSTIDYLIQLINSRKYDVVKMAALALDLITGRGHPFWDGNKRTGHLIADILLRKEGLHIHTEKEKMTRALLKIANYECTVEEIEEWLRRIVRPLQMG